MQMLESLEQTSYPRVPSHNLCGCSFLPNKLNSNLWVNLTEGNDLNLSVCLRSLAT